MHVNILKIKLYKNNFIRKKTNSQMLDAQI